MLPVIPIFIFHAFGANSAGPDPRVRIGSSRGGKDAHLPSSLVLVFALEIVGKDILRFCTTLALFIGPASAPAISEASPEPCVSSLGRFLGAAG